MSTNERRIACRPSNQLSNNRHVHHQTLTDVDGRSFPDQTDRSRGSPHHDLASDEEAAGSIRPPRQGFPPADLFSHRLPDLIVVSDFGSRMGAAMSAQVRPDTVVVAAGRFLASQTSAFGHLLPDALCLLSSYTSRFNRLEVDGTTRRPLSFLS